MTPTEIEEGNKLIAGFMGVPKCDRCDDCGNYKFGSGLYFTTEQMSYHSRWDWLMPVVEKIESIDRGRFGFTIDPHTIEIWDYIPYPEEQIVDVSRNPDGREPLIDTLYFAITEFIKWYNSNTPPPPGSGN